MSHTVGGQLSTLRPIQVSFRPKNVDSVTEISSFESPILFKWVGGYVWSSLYCLPSFIELEMHSNVFQALLGRRRRSIGPVTRSSTLL